MKQEALDDFFRRFRDGVLKLAALKELEIMSPENIVELKQKSDGIDVFVRNKEKLLLNTNEKVDLSGLLKSNKPNDEICRELKKIAENEIRNIIE